MNAVELIEWEKKRDALREVFRVEIHARAREIDEDSPDDGADWHSLTVGWALAKGFTIDEAIRFATYIRYQTELG